jgi:prepilin-type N-terminal cleavage/methylation domain-containing protein
MNTVQKGFTLIELLIVIAILAILTAAVVVVLNPAQLLAQARDAQRLSDTSSVVSAITLWLTTADSPSMTASTSAMVATTTAIFSVSGQPTTGTVKTGTGVTGTGWVPVNLTQATGGSPLGALPIDPTNNASYMYAYCQTATTTFEVNARLESTKYTTKMTNEGGDNTNWYETGTNLAC